MKTSFLLFILLVFSYSVNAQNDVRCVSYKVKVIASGISDKGVSTETNFIFVADSAVKITNIISGKDVFHKNIELNKGDSLVVNYFSYKPYYKDYVEHSSDYYKDSFFNNSQQLIKGKTIFLKINLPEPLNKPFSFNYMLENEAFDIILPEKEKIVYKMP